MSLSRGDTCTSIYECVKRLHCHMSMREEIITFSKFSNRISNHSSVSYQRVNAVSTYICMHCMPICAWESMKTEWWFESYRCWAHSHSGHAEHYGCVSACDARRERTAKSYAEWAERRIHVLWRVWLCARLLHVWRKSGRHVRMCEEAAELRSNGRSNPLTSQHTRTYTHGTLVECISAAWWLPFGISYTLIHLDVRIDSCICSLEPMPPQCRLLAVYATNIAWCTANFSIVNAGIRRHFSGVESTAIGRYWCGNISVPDEPQFSRRQAEEIDCTTKNEFAFHEWKNMCSWNFNAIFIIKNTSSLSEDYLYNKRKQ